MPLIGKPLSVDHHMSSYKGTVVWAINKQTYDEQGHLAEIVLLREDNRDLLMITPSTEEELKCYGMRFKIFKAGEAARTALRHREPFKTDQTFHSQTTKEPSDCLQNVRF